MKESKERKDARLISEIANRAVVLLDSDLVSYVEIVLDLERVHSSVGLKLKQLLHADDGNFMHDISGIKRHLNRRTGELEDCFLPRFAI